MKGFRWNSVNFACRIYTNFSMTFSANLIYHLFTFAYTCKEEKILPLGQIFKIEYLKDLMF